MTGAGDDAASVWGEAQGDAGGEAVLHAAVEAAVEDGEDCGWLRGELDGSADGADEQGYSHGGFEAFAADVAEYEERAAVNKRDDLEEVAAYFLGRLIGGGEGEAGNLGDIFGDEDLLELAGVLEFLFEARLTAAILLVEAIDGVDDRQKQERLGQQLCIYGIAVQKEERRADVVADGPVSEAGTLVEGAGEGGNSIGKEGGEGNQPALRCKPRAAPDSVGDEEERRGLQRSKSSGQNGIDPLDECKPAQRHVRDDENNQSVERKEDH